MSQTYKVQLVTPSEFQKIAESNPRYANVLTEDDPSMAFCDTVEKKIVVPITKSHELNKLMLEHELGHLIETHGTHEDEYGVRHKKMMKTLLPILGGIAGSILLPGIGTALGIGGAGGMGLLGGAAAAGLGAAGGTSLGNLAVGNTRAMGRSALISGGLGAASSLGGGLLGKMTKAPGGTTLGTQTAAPGGGGGTVASKFGSGLAKLTGDPQILGGVQEAGSLGSQIGGAAAKSPMAAFSTAAPMAGLSYGTAAPMAAGGISAPPGGGPGALAQAGQPAAQAGTTAGGPMSKLTGALSGAENTLGMDKGTLMRAGLGLGVSGIGGMLAPTPKVPDFNQIPSIAALRGGAGGPLTGLGAQAQGLLKNRMSSTFQGVDPKITDEVRRQFEVERQQTVAQFKQFRPGANLAEDSAFRQAMLDIDQREGATTANIQQQELSRFQSQQTQDIATSLGIDTQTLNQLTQLAQLDIDQIQMQLGMDAQAARDFKQQFANIGQILATGGKGLGNFTLTPTG